LRATEGGERAPPHFGVTQSEDPGLILLNSWADLGCGGEKVIL